MSESELEIFLDLMRRDGYRNRSRYIRNKLLATRKIRRKARQIKPLFGAADVLSQAVSLRTDIRKIGTNYNQKVKALNSLSKQRDAFGRAVITEEVVSNYLVDMKNMMQHLVEKVYAIEKCVSDYVAAYPEDELSDDGADEPGDSDEPE